MCHQMGSQQRKAQGRKLKTVGPLIRWLLVKSPSLLPNKYLLVCFNNPNIIHHPPPSHSNIINRILVKWTRSNQAPARYLSCSLNQNHSWLLVTTLSPSYPNQKANFHSIYIHICPFLSFKVNQHG